MMSKILIPLVAAVMLLPISLSSTGVPQADENSYTPEEIGRISVDVFFKRIEYPEPGYARFAALWALTEKAKSAGGDTRKEIVDKAITVVGDRSKSFQLRFQCCYLLSGTREERAIPALAKVLLEAKDKELRGVAACALGDFKTDEAKRALRDAREKEKDPGILKDIGKAPGDEAPELTFPFREKRVKQLPWPHQEPGVSKATAQRITRETWVINDFPLYQADAKGENRYFHGGLDIVLDNGTKIYAMVGLITGLLESSGE
jgi:hypothetical protein